MFWYRAIALEQRSQFDNSFIIGIRPKSNWTIGTRSIIRMIFVNQLVAIGRGKLWNGLLATSISGLVNNLLECMNIHGFTFSAEHSTRAMRSEPANGTMHYFTVAQ